MQIGIGIGLEAAITSVADAITATANLATTFAKDQTPAQVQTITDRFLVATAPLNAIMTKLDKLLGIQVPNDPISQVVQAPQVPQASVK